jgi:isopentenyl diphosphate isomerase/L-lactate dehydrogenase-like FMN-dependent dehydrogenase
LGVARAAKSHNILQMLSSVTSTGVEAVNKELGRPVWYQLYAPTPWEACQKIIERVAAAGCEVLVLTVDVNTGRNSETFLRTRPKDVNQCNACHSGPSGPSLKEQPMYAAVADYPGVTRPYAGMDWAYADKMRNLWKGKFVIKGVLTREDTRMAIAHGFDAIQVSNHGGRATETGESTIETLPEIVAEVNKRVPILVDGGFRRGTDVFKALALGARAVLLGRGYAYGLAAAGEAGIDRALAIFRADLIRAMKLLGCASVAELDRSYVEKKS